MGRFCIWIVTSFWAVTSEEPFLDDLPMMPDHPRWQQWDERRMDEHRSDNRRGNNRRMDRPDNRRPDERHLPDMDRRGGRMMEERPSDDRPRWASHTINLLYSCDLRFNQLLRTLWSDLLKQMVKTADVFSMYWCSEHCLISVQC